MGWSGCYCGACLVTSDFEWKWIGFPTRGNRFINLFAINNVGEVFHIGLFTVTYRKCTKSQYKVADASLLYGATRFQSLVASGDHLAFLLTLIILATWPGALPLWGQILSPSFLDKLPVSRLMWHWCHFQYHHGFGSICLKLLWSDPAALLDDTYSAIFGPDYVVMAKVLIIQLICTAEDYT